MHHQITCLAPRSHTRRTFLSAAVATVAAAILAACGDASAPTVTVAPTVPASRTTTSSPTTPIAAAPASNTPAIPRMTAQPTGELRIVVASYPNTLDALKETNVLRFGLGETLMRLSPQYKLEPWLAQSLTNVDPLTWRVALRPNAKFWDGTPVTADAVIAAFRRNWEAYPNAHALISKDTRLTAVDPTTVEFKTPKQIGAFPNALAASSFIVHKPQVEGGADGSMLTGPYRVTKFAVDGEFTLEPNRNHWGGPPPIARITVKKVVDPSAEALALQAGDTDLIYRVPPEVTKGLGNEFTVSAIPSTIVDQINLNLRHSPLDDRAVREATAWAIDRATLINVGLDGKGIPAPGALPPNLDNDVVTWQITDHARTAQLLDDADWKIGNDGVRAKNGKRLAFTLLSGDPAQPELAAFAVSIQQQLKPLGYDLTITQVQNANDATKAGTFDAVLRSSNSLQTGDPLFALDRLFAVGGASNTGGYTNPQIIGLLDQLRPEIDPVKRQALSHQIQELARADIPDIFLTVIPLVVAYRTKTLKRFVPHPDDTYLISSDWLAVN